MSSPTPDPFADAAFGDEPIPTFADWLDRLLDVQSGVPAPALIGYTPDDDGVTLAVTLPEFDDRGAGASLFGFVAPADWSAVGMSIIGQARSTDHRRDPSGDARVDLLLDRSGALRTRLTLDGEIAPDDATARPGGVLVDALHRVLGLPCPGSPPPATAMLVGLWLEQVLAMPRGLRRPTWTDAVDDDSRRGPAKRSVPRSPECVAESIARAASTIDWAELRLIATGEENPRFDLGADEAAWMDIVMFGRWLVGSVPSPGAVRRELGQTADPALIRGIDQVVERLGLPDDWLFEDLMA